MRTFVQATLDISEAATLAIEIDDEIQLENALAIAATVLDALGIREAAVAAVAPLGEWLAYPHHGRRRLVPRVRAFAQHLPRVDLADPPSIRAALTTAVGRLADEPTR